MWNKSDMQQSTQSNEKIKKKKAIPRVEHDSFSMWDSLKVNSLMTLEPDQLTGHRSTGSHSTEMWVTAPPSGTYW